MATNQLRTLSAILLVGYGCSSAAEPDCGPAGELRDGQCVAVGTCGPGTRLVNGVCSLVDGPNGGAEGGRNPVAGYSGGEETAGAPGSVAGSDTVGDSGSGGDAGIGGALGAGGDAGLGGQGSPDSVGGAAAGSAGADGGEGNVGGGGDGGCHLSPESDSLSAVTFQIDPAHTGGQPLSSLHAPLKRCWSTDLGVTSLSYPLIAHGRVFLTGLTPSGSRLYALAESDGHTLWGPVNLGTHNDSYAAAALNADKVFAIGDGSLSAFNAATGAPVWSRPVVSTLDAGAPVVAGGKVYAVNNHTLAAYDETTGMPLWSAQYAGSPTSVAYTPSLLVFEYIQGDISALDPSSGALLWHNKGWADGGGGDIPAIYQGHIFAPDLWGFNEVLDLKGNLLGSFSGAAVPAFENGLGFFLAGTTLEAHDLNGTVKWSFAGDKWITSNPLAAGGAVYEGSTFGMLYAFDELTGKMLWQEDVGAKIRGANPSGPGAPNGLAASGQLLVVPTASGVVAYGN